MIKKHILTLLLIATLPVEAAQFFGGAGVNIARFKTQLTTPRQDQWHNVNAYHFEFGVQFNPSWSLAMRRTEFAAQHIGSFGAIETQSSAFVHRYDFFPNSKWNLYSLIGANLLEQSAVDGSLQLSKQRVLQPVLGLGAGVDMGANQRLGLEWSAYSKRAMLLGLNYQFGSFKLTQSPK